MREIRRTESFVLRVQVGKNLGRNNVKHLKKK